MKKLIFKALFIFSLNAGKIDRAIKDFSSSAKLKKITHPMSNLREQYSSNAPYKNISAHLETGYLSKDEKKLIKRRKTKIAKFIKKIYCLKTKPQNVPNVGICISGGGYRAMIATLGFLSELEKNNTLDLVEYISTLSGSSWALASWISSDQVLSDFINDVKKNIKSNPMLIKNRGTLPLVKGRERTTQLNSHLATKFVFHQPLSIIDIYGSMVLNNLLNHKKNIFDLTLSNQRKRLEKDSMFMPIYTAVTPDSNKHPISYTWYEFNPFVSRNTKNGLFSPIWAFGRKFNNGKSEPSQGITCECYPPELPLSNFMGIFGSALSANIKDAIKFFKGQIPNADENTNLKFEKFLKTDEKFLNISNARLTVSGIYNPEFKISTGTNSKYRISNFLDGGADFNMPIAPLLIPDKEVDVIIMFDVTGQLHPNTPALRDSEKYARLRNLKFPKIVYDKLSEKEISIFEGSPTIIYIPFTNSCLNSFCNTINFTYNEDDFNYVLNRAKEIAKNVDCKIKNEIEKVANKKIKEYKQTLKCCKKD